MSGVQHRLHSAVSASDSVIVATVSHVEHMRDDPNPSVAQSLERTVVNATKRVARRSRIGVPGIGIGIDILLALGAGRSHGMGRF